MAGPPLVYSPPSYTTTNVLYGIGILFTATVGTAVPSDQNLGVGSAWTGLGWAYVGATEAGVTVTFNPSVQDLNIEEQPTPVAVAISTATLQVTCSLSEETLANVNLAWGNGGSIAVTSPGAGQPGKSVLTLSTNFQNMACALVGRNQLGYARVLSIPTVMSAGQVQTAYRRAAAQRLYPLTLNAICPFNQITWTDLTAIATSEEARMPGFVAEGVVEGLDYDFRPYVNAHGTIPEPTDKRIEAFLKGVKRIYQEAKASTPQLDEDASPGGLLNALDLLDPDATIAVMTGMSEVYADLCGGTPSKDEIASLPMRVRTIFFAWLQTEVMAPEAVSAAGNGQVRKLPTARGA